MPLKGLLKPEDDLIAFEHALMGGIAEQYLGLGLEAFTL